MYLGIDLGTSGVKIILTNRKGKIISEINKNYPVNYLQDGMVEQNPSDWLNKTIVGLKEIVKNTKTKIIDAISFSGQMHGLVTLDKNDSVIRPCILWNDNRSKKETDYLNKIIGQEKIVAYTGNIAFPGFTAPKILWMYNNERENFDRISKIMLPKDYLVYCFTNNFVTDYSDASGTLLLDVKNKKWSDEMIEICHLKKDNLPKLCESIEVVGILNKKIAKEIGLENQPKIVIGAADNVAAAIGTKTVGQNQANISIGTSGTILLTSENFVNDDGNHLHAFCHGDGKWYLMGCILSAASAIDWWTKKVIHKTNSESQQDLKISELGDNNIYFLPYLVGERCPHNDPFAKALFIGITPSTSDKEMTQAVLEGVAFAIRDCYEAAKKEGIRPTCSRICGGGANSELWVNIFANVLNLPLEILDTNNGAALGAAIMAMVGNGEYSSIVEATSKIINVKRTIYPDKMIVEKYNKNYNFYKKIYPIVKDLYKL